MIFDEIPFELKEHIFTYVTPNEWINTAKVSNEWMDLTLRSIKKVESCHLFILYHLAKFINEHHNTNYTWVSLVAKMPKLEHLECFENIDVVLTEISPVCHQLKVLDCNPTADWNNLDISFKNLVELRCGGRHEGAALLLRIFELAPKLEKITLQRLKINAEWKHKIPKSVKHILLKDVQFLDEHQCSLHNLCEDSSTLETFSAFYDFYPLPLRTNFFDAKGLKKLELSHPNATKILEDAFTNCPNLETVFIDVDDIHVTDSWRKRIPPSVKSFKTWRMSLADNVRPDFSFNWLFQNYGALQSLEVHCLDWTGFDPKKFHSPKNLRKLSLDNERPSRNGEPNDPFSTICKHMIGGSHLVDVEIYGMTIDESWRNVFPPTLKRLQLRWFQLSIDAKKVFSPQFICENPSNIEFLSLIYFDGALNVLDLNAFSGMSKLEELRLISLYVSGECLQSILTHCSALTNLFIQGLTAGALTNIPRNLVLPSLRTLDVTEPVGQPSLLLQHFPKIRKVDITIVPTKECWLEAMSSLQGVEIAKISVKEPSCYLLRSLIEYIDDTKFKYFRLSGKKRLDKIFTFYLTNSLLDACTDFHSFNTTVCVMCIKNYPSSPLVRESMFCIPSSMDELLQRYHDIMAQVDDSDDDSDDDDNGVDDNDGDDDDDDGE